MSSAEGPVLGITSSSASAMVAEVCNYTEVWIWGFLSLRLALLHSKTREAQISKLGLQMIPPHFRCRRHQVTDDTILVTHEPKLILRVTLAINL